MRASAQNAQGTRTERARARVVRSPTRLPASINFTKRRGTSHSTKPLGLGFVRYRTQAYNPQIVIDTTLSFLVDEVNAHLVKRTGAELGAVSVGPICDDRGLWTQAMDTMRLTVFQIDEERTMREQLPARTLIGGREMLLPPPLKLNLVLLFAGRFQQYEQALRTLSLILSFFQARPLFTPASHPALPEGVERIAMDLLSQGPEQMNQMWACFGAKHLPSVVYRLRMVMLQDLEPTGTGAPITVIETSVVGQ